MDCIGIKIFVLYPNDIQWYDAPCRIVVKAGQYMDSKTRVKRAIQLKETSSIPMLYFNRDREQSDIIIDDIGRNFIGENQRLSQWGFEWDRLDGSMGQPKEAVLKEWSELDAYHPPNGKDMFRFDRIHQLIDQYGTDKYYMASFELSGFTIMSFLRGFDQLMMDLVLYPDEVDRLADRVFQYEYDVISSMKDQPYDCIAFYDDWGTQDNLLISPAMWRSVFRPRYQWLFDRAHEMGLDVYFHSCGYIQDILDDFIDMGVDLMNISQPNLYDIEALGQQYGGRVCFVCPVSYQTTSITGTPQDIYRDVKAFVDHLRVKDSGLIGYIEEYGSMGMSEENYQACVQAFCHQGVYPSDAE